MPVSRERTLVRSTFLSDRVEQRHAIEQAAQKVMSEAGYSPLRQIRCEFDHGTLTLLGFVPSYYIKQVASTAVVGLLGVTVIDNQLVVKPGKRRSRELSFDERDETKVHQ